MQVSGDSNSGDFGAFKEENKSKKSEPPNINPDVMLGKAVESKKLPLKKSAENIPRSSPEQTAKYESKKVIAEAKKIVDKAIAKNGKIYQDYEIRSQFNELKDSISIEKFLDNFNNLEDVFNIIGKDTILFDSAAKGSLRVVQLAVEKFGASTSRRFEADTPILQAATSGHLPIVQYLAKISKYEDLFQKADHKASLLEMATFRDQVEVSKWIIDNRNELKLSIAGFPEALSYLLEKNFSSVSQFLSKYVQISLNPRQSTIDQIQDVIKAAYTKDAQGNTLLHHAVKEGNRVMVDVLLAAGLLPDAKNNLDETPLSLMKDEQIKQSLNLSLEKHILFRLRQLEHLLKDASSATMTRSQDFLSWATLIASIDENKQASKPLADLRTGLVRSLAVSFVLENSHFTRSEQEGHVDKVFGNLKPKEWLLIIGHYKPGHHNIILYEKDTRQGWKALEGDRYRHGGKYAQFADAREYVTDTRRIKELLYSNKMGIGIKENPKDQKIQKKWQGAQNNCVTQSDTVAFEYLLAEQLGVEKNAYYRQIKPSRIMFLCSSLAKLNKLPTLAEHHAWNWFIKPMKIRLSDLHPQILTRRQVELLSPSAQPGESYLVAEKDKPQFSVWSHGSKTATKRIPWTEALSFLNQSPTVSPPLTQRLVHERLKNLFGGSKSGITLQKPGDGAEYLECSYFTNPIQLPIKVLTSGAIVVKPANRKAVVFNDLNSLIEGLPKIFFQHADAKDESLKTELLEKWIDIQLRRAIRRKQEELKITDKVMDGKTIETLKDELMQYLVEQFNKKNFTMAKLAFCFEAQQLLEDKDLQNCFRDIGKLWVEMLSNVEIKNERPNLFSKAHPTAYVTLPEKWKETLSEKTSLIINKSPTLGRFF